MRNPQTEWRYSDHVPVERQNDLARLNSFEEVIGEIVNELDDAENFCAYAKPGNSPGLTDCLQPVFSFDLPKTGDILFNGPHGYRAQYWIDPWCGLAANGALMVALASRLIAAIEVEKEPQFDEFNVCASLKAVSAKIWIEETPSTVNKDNQGLEVEPWVSKAESGYEKAKLGLTAPQVSKFEVKGALLDHNGNERVPADKIRRHFDLHNYGFS